MTSGSYYRDRLISTAQSDDYQERASAGPQLAAFAGDIVVDSALVQLLLDVEDSDVTSETVQALLARRDEVGMRLVAEALASDESKRHWLDFSLGVVLKSTDESSWIEAVCRSLTGDQDEVVRRGARELLDRLAAPDFGSAADKDHPVGGTPEGVSTWLIEPWEPGI